MSARPNTSSAVPRIEAPAASYCSSGMPEPAPASCSTTTRWPAAVSARTPAGTSPTRFSLSLISRGRPMIMRFLRAEDSVRSRPSAAISLVGVDLRLLESTREVDVDRLPLGEHVEARDARLAMAVARVLATAERQVHLGADRGRVDVEDPRLEVAHRRERLVDVLRVDRARQAVRDRVRDPDALLERRDRHDRRHGTEDLLAGDPHARVGVGEDGRL